MFWLRNKKIDYAPLSGALLFTLKLGLRGLPVYAATLHKVNFMH